MAVDYFFVCYFFFTASIYVVTLLKPLVLLGAAKGSCDGMIPGNIKFQKVRASPALKTTPKLKAAQHLGYTSKISDFFFWEREEDNIHREKKDEKKERRSLNVQHGFRNRLCQAGWKGAFPNPFSVWLLVLITGLWLQRERVVNELGNKYLSINKVFPNSGVF